MTNQLASLVRSPAPVQCSNNTRVLCVCGVETKINKRIQKFARLSSQIGFGKIEKECGVPHSNVLERQSKGGQGQDGAK